MGKRKGRRAVGGQVPSDEQQTVPAAANPKIQEQQHQQGMPCALQLQPPDQQHQQGSPSWPQLQPTQQQQGCSSWPQLQSTQQQQQKQLMSSVSPNPPAPEHQQEGCPSSGPCRKKTNKQKQKKHPGTLSQQQQVRPTGPHPPASEQIRMPLPEKLVQERSLTAGADIRPPRRPDFGKLGKEISLSVNHFPVTIKNKTIYHYDVSITPTANKTTLKEVVYQLFQTEPRLKKYTLVFDGRKNMYSPKKIEGFNSQVEIKHTFQEGKRDPSEYRTFTITIKPTTELEIDLTAIDSYLKNGSSTNIPFRGIQALDIILKYSASQRMTIIGNNVISKLQGVKPLSDGVEVWFGHFQSLRLGSKPYLNVNATQKPMLTAGLVHEVMAKMFNAKAGAPLHPRHYDSFARKLRNMKVSYSRLKYEAKVGVNGLKGPADKESFEHDGQRITVQQYFEKEYKCKLKYPSLPCLWVGNKQKNILVPMEVCTILEGQEYKQKLDENETRELLRCSATPAYLRKKKILDCVKSMDFGRNEYCQNYGLSISSEMLQVTGRVLPPPALAYGEKEDTIVKPIDGTWNMVNTKFVVPMSLEFWGIISVCRFQQNPDHLWGFAKSFFNNATKMGMRVQKPLFAEDIGQGYKTIEGALKNYKQRYPKLQILFVVIDRKGAPEYEIVKKIGDTEVLLTTQCLQIKNLNYGEPKPATVVNICLKVNAKLGGINNLIQRDCRPGMLLNEQIIIMGADVTHPGAEQPESGKPSIAAVVGSVDPRASQYCAEIRMQKSKQEYIEDMEGMVYNILRKFNRITGTTSTGKPQRIIFFRDGVSEGQFAKVLQHELRAIQKACIKLENDYDPLITFIVVQKRHHTRLFPNNINDQVGKGGNVPPGTVVDREIVHPTESDFYLVSHLGIQGTSRPTKYHVLWDENHMTADDVQKLAYYLCYMFSRCTRSVSYPAPCYYAHLVAYRARQYYEGYKNLSNKDLQQHVDETRNLKPMFFV